MEPKRRYSPIDPVSTVSTLSTFPKVVDRVERVDIDTKIEEHEQFQESNESVSL